MSARTGDGSHQPHATPDASLAATLRQHLEPALTAMRESAEQGRLTNRSTLLQFDGAAWTVAYRPDWKDNQVVGYIVEISQDLRGGFVTNDVACAEATLTELGYEGVQRRGNTATGNLPLKPFTLVD